MQNILLYRVLESEKQRGRAERQDTERRDLRTLQLRLALGSDWVGGQGHEGQPRGRHRIRAVDRVSYTERARFILIYRYDLVNYTVVRWRE